MKESYADAANTPPARLSTWQLRFGKKSNQSESKFEVGAQARSQSISEQLLHALDKKPKTVEKMSRDCVETLIGRRNAFVKEPELRLSTLAYGKSPEECIHFDNEDVATEAKEILRLRFEVETKANLLRRTPGRQQTDIKPQAGPKVSAASKLINGRDAKLNHKASRHPDIKESRACSKQSVGDNNRAERRLPRSKFHTFGMHQPKTKPKQDIQVCDTKTKSLSTGSLPPRQLPMERRHIQQEQARKIRRMKAAEEDAMKKFVVTSGRKESQEQRWVEKRIEHLISENQHHIALEEQLQRRKERFKSLSQVFRAWYQCVEYKREQEVRVAAVFKWRAMKCIMSEWKRFTYSMRQEKAADEARLVMIQLQQANERAMRFYRLKCLTPLLYRWMTFVAQQKNHRVNKEATEKRRTQTEKLLERLQRPTPFADRVECDFGNVKQPENAGTDYSFRENSDQYASAQSCAGTTASPVKNCPNRKHGVSGADEKHQAALFISEKGACSELLSLQTSPLQLPMPPPKRINTISSAMEQRATERKLRREQLKRRYEEIEQKKKQLEEEQRAAREAQLHQQQIDERIRIRERKHADALALMKKKERREYLIAQYDKANKHNRRRLLFYYALLPLQKYHVLNERILRNARRWHELRTIFTLWGQWQEFVKIRQKLHRRRERVQLTMAAKYHAQSLQRRAFSGMTLFHRALVARASAVQRQHLWNTLQLSWFHWHRRLADERVYQRQVVFETTAKLRQNKLRRIYAHWRKATCDEMRQHQLEHEKQQLWRKVRGWLDEEA